jgi:hypothetical protein
MSVPHCHIKRSKQGRSTAVLGISVFEAIRRMEAKSSSERRRRIASSISLWPSPTIEVAVGSLSWAIWGPRIYHMPVESPITSDSRVASISIWMSVALIPFWRRQRQTNVNSMCGQGWTVPIKYRFIFFPLCPGHHHGSGPPDMDVYVCMAGAITRHLSNVCRTPPSSQKSEAQKSMKERHELRGGSRERSIISALLNLSRLIGNAHRSQRSSRYMSCDEWFHPEYAR